jgi:hypothetical protein
VGEVLGSRFNLAVSLLCDTVIGGVARHVFVLLLLRVKRWGSNIFFFALSTLCHHASSITLFVMNLIPCDACWIAVKGWSNSSRCRWIFGLLVSDVMPLY